MLDCIRPHWMQLSNIAVYKRHWSAVISPAIVISPGTPATYMIPYSSDSKNGTNGSQSTLRLFGIRHLNSMMVSAVTAHSTSQLMTNQ